MEEKRQIFILFNFVFLNHIFKENILFILMKLNENYIKFYLSSIFFITNSQWKLFLHLPIKLISKKTQKTILQILTF